MAIQYQVPTAWIGYDGRAIVDELARARAAILSLTSIPYQRSWADRLQKIQLKLEVAGTSRIEGADFTERELDIAISEDRPDSDLTRSQRQARAALNTYRWIAQIPTDRPIDASMILEAHRRIVTGCDDDHCPPGKLREAGHNVTFGTPRHRGAEGGEECGKAFSRLCAAVTGEFQGHDPLIQALALHYHLGAIHPFHDGNGRTARVLEALALQRARLKDDLFITMSNYYYDEKDRYLATLSECQKNNHDLTPFLKFGLHGVALQCMRLLGEINTEISKVLFRDVMYKMYNRLLSTRKRALAQRQMAILSTLLELPSVEMEELRLKISGSYSPLKEPFKAFIRDLNYLFELNAIKLIVRDGIPHVAARLEWPTEITETAFLKAINALPKAKSPLL